MFGISGILIGLVCIFPLIYINRQQVKLKKEKVNGVELFTSAYDQKILKVKLIANDAEDKLKRSKICFYLMKENTIEKEFHIIRKDLFIVVHNENRFSINYFVEDQFNYFGCTFDKRENNGVWTEKSIVLFLFRNFSEGYFKDILNYDQKEYY
jgi:hypothetical protein